MESHKCHRRCKGVLPPDIRALNNQALYKTAREHCIIAEWIPSVIDTSSKLQHPNAKRSGIKYQFLLALRADIDVTGLVLCNRTLHCDVRKAALKGLILTVQAMVGFYFETPGDAMPPIEFVRLWKESLVGYRQTVQWYENVFVNCFCPPFKQALSKDDAKATKIISTCIHKFFDEDLTPLSVVTKTELKRTDPNKRKALFLDDDGDRQMLRDMLERPCGTCSEYKRMCLLVPTNV